MDKVEYLHQFKIEEQIEMETQKILAKYDISNYDNKDFFIVVAEEFGEIASNINHQNKIGIMNNNTQENLEYELLQLITISKLWLNKLRVSKSADE